MLLAQLRADQLTARKNKDAVAADLLGTLIGEAVKEGKAVENRDPTDAEILKIAAKFKKDARETRDHQAKHGGDTSKTDREIEILDRYLPTQMSEDDLKAAIDGFVAANPGANMGTVMAFLKSNHGGLYDGKAASGLVKAALAG